MTIIARIISVLCIIPLLAGCAALDWLGDDKAPPLKGKRVAVFESHPALGVESKMLDKEPVMVPAASLAVAWPYSVMVPGMLPENIQLSAEKKRASYQLGTFSLKQISQTVPVINENQAFTLSCDGSLFSANLQGSAHFQREVTHLFNTHARMHFNKRCQNTAMASYGGQLYVSLGGAEVLALDAATKKILWQYDTPGAVHLPPVVTEKEVAVLTTDNALIVLNRLTGEPNWQQQMIEEEVGVLGQAMPILYQGALIVPFSNGVLVAYHLESGQVLWTANLAYSRFQQTGFQFNDIATTPVIKDGVLYIAGNAGALFAIRVSNGELLWQNLWVAGNSIFAKTQDHHVIALNRFNGQVKWNTDLAHDAKLRKIFGTQQAKLMTSGLMMVEGKLLVTSSLETMAVLSPTSGDVERAVSIPSTHAGPVITGGSVYIFSTNHRLVPIHKAAIFGK
jgi:outer membrane protein assembly factor BamB